MLRSIKFENQIQEFILESNTSVGSYNPIILKYLALGREAAMRVSNKQKFESVIL